MGGFAWVTLATNDSYSLGALVLAHSLRQVNTVHQLAVLITPAVSAAMRSQLESVFDLVKIVDVLDSKDAANLALLKRPELGITFTKLHCWQLTQFEKGVFLDADTLVVRNSDELFEREEFSAAPDVGWPDCFNSGVFVFRPSNETFNNLVQFAVEKGSFDGGDQGLLNQFFHTWATDDIQKHLPFIYNLTSVAVYSYIPAFKQYGADSRIVHFIGPVKPWLQAVDPATRAVTPSADSVHLQPLLQKWWDIFIDKVHPGLSTDLEYAFGMLPFFAQPACSQDPLDCSHARSDPFPPPPPLPPPPPPPFVNFPDPYTPYIENDDERQWNLPYQPFQVVSTDGELLNITFADFARDAEPEEVVEEFLSEPVYEEPPAAVENHDNHETYETENVQDAPFDFHQFVPDETCINAYLEHNVQEYQPYDLNPFQPASEPLPRFLTIPEDDSRQSQKPYEPDLSWYQPEEDVLQPWVEPHHVHDNAAVPAVPTNVLPKSQSMTNLSVDATNAAPFQNLITWQSQPDVRPAEPAKKLPGLKPLVPKIKSPSKFATTAPKYTEFTEVNMIADLSDPFAPPVDNIGFVERAINKSRNLNKFSDFPVISKPSIPHPSVFQPIPLINEYVDLAECKRQTGNCESVAKILPKRTKRGKMERKIEKWKPPVTTCSMYDVDAIIERLSQFSIGYFTPDNPDTPEAGVKSDLTETPADRLFGNSVFDQNTNRNDGKKQAKTNFGPLAYSSPFAAVFGESLSESEPSVPEIVISVASPDVPTTASPIGLNDSLASKTGTEDEVFLTPIGGVTITSSEEDSFVSALSNTSNVQNDEELGIFGVKDWEEKIEKNLTKEKTKSYATILKTEQPIAVGTKPVVFSPSISVAKPKIPNGRQRPRKEKKVKPVELPVISVPTKYSKRKINEPVAEFPVNRFQLLPDESGNLKQIRKKSKKSQRFGVVVASSSSLPLDSLSTSSVAIDDEEEAGTPYLPEPDDNPGIAGAIAQLKLDPTTTEADAGNSAAQAEYLRRQSWETGQVDYMGRDSFANVWSKISETLSETSIPENPLPTAAPSTEQ